MGERLIKLEWKWPFQSKHKTQVMWEISLIKSFHVYKSILQIYLHKWTKKYM